MRCVVLPRGRPAVTSPWQQQLAKAEKKTAPLFRFTAEMQRGGRRRGSAWIMHVEMCGATHRCIARIESQVIYLVCDFILCKTHLNVSKGLRRMEVGRGAAEVAGWYLLGSVCGGKKFVIHGVRRRRPDGWGGDRQATAS